MATARNVGTAGWIFFINFAHRVKAHNNLCLVYTKFNALSYGYKLSFFGEAIALHGLVHFLNTTGSSLTKSFRVVYAYFNRISLRISYVKNTMTELGMVHQDGLALNGFCGRNGCMCHSLGQAHGAQTHTG